MTTRRIQRLFSPAMKRERPRNEPRWAAKDRRELKLRLKYLSRISAYVAVAVMPGGLAMLPVMAWWLKRRRGRSAARVLP